MSIARWGWGRNDELAPQVGGPWVKFTDAEKWATEAVAAERERIRTGVTGLPDWQFCDAVCGTERSVLAAIDALRGAE